MENSTDWHLILDIVIFIVCFFALLIYQIHLYRSIRKQPDATVQGINARARAAWVEEVMHHGRDILAVQTFRNSVMAATLMASTAVLLIFGILNMLASADKIGSVFHIMNSFGSHDPGIRNFKYMLLIIEFFIAFFAFSLVVRGYHHAGFLVNVPLRDSEDEPGRIKTVVHTLDRTSGYYSIGMRSYYFSVPVVMWLFGPLWMLLATIILLAILNHMDHLPE